MPLFGRKQDDIEELWCRDVDFGGNLAQDHPGTQRHVCDLFKDHTEDHRCSCGWSWHKWRRGKKK